MITEETADQVFTQCGVPESLHGGLKRYLFDRIKPGSFLRSVLENDLVGAMANADDANRYHLHALAGFLYNEMPARDYGNPPWGSKEAVTAWIAEGQDRPQW